MVSRVPSPPSAKGAISTWSLGRIASHPDSRATATSIADADPLKESGAITIFELGIFVHFLAEVAPGTCFVESSGKALSKSGPITLSKENSVNSESLYR